jgi:hypothetical protein
LVDRQTIDSSDGQPAAAAAAAAAAASVDFVISNLQQWKQTRGGSLVVSATQINMGLLPCSCLLTPHTTTHNPATAPTANMQAATTATRRRVVVTGIGIVSPLGLGTAATWEALTAGRVGTRALTEADDGIPPSMLQQLPCRVAAALPSRPHAPPGLGGAWSRGQLSPFIQYALAAAEEALVGGGGAAPRWRAGEDGENGERAGCYIGTGIGCLDEIVGADRTLETGGVRRLSPHFVPKILGNLATGQVS